MGGRERGGVGYGTLPIPICILSIGISTLLEKKLECMYGILTEGNGNGVP